jgi:hypothetical protein
MRLTEAYGSWQGGQLTQAEAAQLRGGRENTFHRYFHQYEEDGMDGLNEQRTYPMFIPTGRIHQKRSYTCRIHHRTLFRPAFL